MLNVCIEHKNSKFGERRSFDANTKLSVLQEMHDKTGCDIEIESYFPPRRKTDGNHPSNPRFLFRGAAMRAR